MQAGQRAAVQRAMIDLAQGNRAAFSGVFNTLWPLLRRFAQVALDNPTQAEDAAQAALMKLFVHAAKFDPDRDALAWALGFVSFECLSLRKAKARRREQVDHALLAAQPSSDRTPEDQAIERELRSAATEAVGFLRQQDIDVLTAMMEGQRPSGPNRVRAAFRKRVQRAIERLRAAWRNKHGID